MAPRIPRDGKELPQWMAGWGGRWRRPAVAAAGAGGGGGGGDDDDGHDDGWAPFVGGLRVGCIRHHWLPATVGGPVLARAFVWGPGPSSCLNPRRVWSCQ